MSESNIDIKKQIISKTSGIETPENEERTSEPDGLIGDAIHIIDELAEVVFSDTDEAEELEKKAIEAVKRAYEKQEEEEKRTRLKELKDCKNNLRQKRLVRQNAIRTVNNDLTPIRKEPKSPSPSFEKAVFGKKLELLRALDKKRAFLLGIITFVLGLCLGYLLAQL